MAALLLVTPPPTPDWIIIIVIVVGDYERKKLMGLKGRLISNGVSTQIWGGDWKRKSVDWIWCVDVECVYILMHTTRQANVTHDEIQA